MSNRRFCAETGSCIKPLGAHQSLSNSPCGEVPASAILSISKPYNVADDWALYKQYGVKLKAIHPYLIDANVNMDLLGSDVHQDTWGIDKKRMSKMNLFRTIKGGLLKRIFSTLGHFESKIRVINNIVVD